MVKSKKMSKSAIAIIVLALLLVLSMVLGLTGAWFTDTKSSSGSSLNFGEITISLNEDEHMFELTQTVESDYLMPGDTIEGSFTVSNAKDACFVRYNMVFELNEALVGADAEAVDGAFVSAGYSVVTAGKKWQISLGEAQKVALASGRDIPQTSAALGGDVTIPVGVTDAAENKVLTISLSVYAIQQDNYVESSWATAFPAVYGA